MTAVHAVIDKHLTNRTTALSDVMRAGKRACLVAALLLASACAQPPQRDVTVQQASAPLEKDLSGAQMYSIDSQASELHILVYRGGTLARLGHNHVVSSKSLRGRAWLHERFERSGFELTLPVITLIVDDPSLRKLYGESFASELSLKDIEGTRRNLLKPEVLDAERFAKIKLISSKVSGTLQAPRASAHITIKGVTREVAIPLELEVREQQLIASGSFDLLQSDFGIKPFSIALGALQVQDKLRVNYRIVAARQSEPP